MQKKLAYILEILLSASIVIGLLWVAFYVHPSATVNDIKPSPFGKRENYFGVVAPSSDGKLIWAVGRKGRIIRTDDGGNNWVIQQTPVSHVHLQDIDTWDERSAIVVGDLGTVMVTSDGGVTWQSKDLQLRQFGEQLMQVVVDKTDGRAWIAGAMGSVFVSDDHGESWRITHPEEDLSWNSVSIAPGGTVWLVGEFGRISRSDDQGMSWQQIEAGAEQSLMDIAFSDNTLGVAVGLAGTLLVTEDGGETWSSITGITDNHIYDVSWDGHQFVAVGDGGILLTSDSSGRDWQAGKLGAENSLWYTAIVPLSDGSSDRQYLAAGANLGIHQNDRWIPYTQMRKEPEENTHGTSQSEGTL
ncbi:MAG: glycosyl hydrolase [Candidatus Thiodiazotropha sp. (ex Lucinoma borealis)]|nr:glycosyl hydrolase [Candidatus Thiodiazotropha sp. (ex Lucinoma borealis)]MCU7869800.1 glycosyl hydrolase [Candidatus Thiodiazotropha sp. (ex Lucinoma borealis)]